MRAKPRFCTESILQKEHQVPHFPSPYPFHLTTDRKGRSVSSELIQCHASVTRLWDDRSDVPGT
ncbi:unnamed protein product [Ixodes pacificus]